MLDRARWIILPVAVVALTGCGNRKTIYPVQGKITYEGKPLVGGGSIAFVPLSEQAGKTAGGTIAEDGTYQLTTHEPGDGSMVGDFRVVITQASGKEPARTVDGQPAAKALPAMAPGERIPAIYADHYQSPLTARVEAKASNVLDFDLRSKQGRPPSGFVTQLTVTTISAERGVSVHEGPPAPTGTGWLIDPWFDVFFIANLAWPLLVLTQVGEGFGGQAGLLFWQLYFVTTPHRWITLLIVFLDRERLAQRRVAFLALAAAVTLVCLGVRLTTGALTCLLTIDYLWNAWHFASQHHGIYRIYSGLGGAAPFTGRTLEKWAMRGFLLYVIFRVASATWSDAILAELLGTCDWLAAIVPAWLVVRDLTHARAYAVGRSVYLLSVICLYLCMLWAVHERRLGWLLTLATASALFHALEYLAVVSWSVRRRHAAIAGRMGILGFLAPRWGIALAVFAVVLGAGGWFMDQRFLEDWLFINVIVAFLHYAYDGLIWRRQPAT